MNIAAFKNNKSFWMAQLLGWAIFGLSNFTIQSLIGMPFILVMLNSLNATLAGFLITTLYRYAIRGIKWSGWRLFPLLLFIFFSSLVLAITWLVLTGLLFEWIIPQFQLSKNEILANLATGGLLFLVWNFIYFFFQYFVKFHQIKMAT